MNGCAPSRRGCRRAVGSRPTPGFPRETTAAAQAVFAVAAERLDPGEVDKIIRHSPGALRTLWPVEAGGR